MVFFYFDAPPSLSLESPTPKRNNTTRVIFLSITKAVSPSRFLHDLWHDATICFTRPAHQEQGHRPPCQKLQLRDLRSFQHSEPPSICRCTSTGMSTTVSTHQRGDLDCLLTDCTRNLLDVHNRGIEHLVNELQQENHHSILNSQDQGKLPLRHDRDVDDLDDRELRTWRCTKMGMSNPVQERHLKNLDGELHSLHCGYLSLHAKQEHPTTVDELNLGHPQVKKLLEIVAAWSQGRPTKNCSTKSPPAPPHPAPSHPLTIRERTLGLPGAAQDRCNKNRLSLCTVLLGPRVRGSHSRRR